MRELVVKNERSDSKDSINSDSNCENQNYLDNDSNVKLSFDEECTRDVAEPLKYDEYLDFISSINAAKNSDIDGLEDSIATSDENELNESPSNSEINCVQEISHSSNLESRPEL